MRRWLLPIDEKWLLPIYGEVARSAGGAAPEGLAECVNPRQLPVQPGVVEAVADHEAVGDDKAGEVDLDRDLAPRRPVEQRGHAQRGRLPPAKPSQNRVDRPARVDDILDQEGVAALQRSLPPMGD